MATKRVFISKSKIHGQGLFASRNFKRGDIVFILKGKIKKLHIKNQKDSAMGPNWIGLSKEIWLDPSYPFMFLNHSCNPNMGIKGKVTFVALKSIKKGDELTFDYSTTEDDVYWQFNCGCKSSNCRKKIKSIQFLPQKTYQHYLPFMPRYFMKVYNVSHNLE